MENEQVRIQKLLSRVPFLSEENCREILPYSTDKSNIAYYGDLQRCAELLRNKYNGEVNGLWFIRVPAVDGGVQTIVRTRSKLPTLKGLELAADVFDHCCDELGYRITDDDVSGLNSIPIEEWLEDGQVFAVFDDER